MKIIFDLDHTLFKAALFKEDLFDILVKNGASREDVLETYKVYRDKVKGAYDFVAHADILDGNAAGFKKAGAVREWEDFLRGDFTRYVDREVFEVLEGFKNKGFELILLTRGHPDLQSHKIKKSGLDVFFDEIHICQGGKLPELEKIKPQAGDWLVNDTWKEAVEARQEYPELNQLLLKIDDNWQLQNRAEIDIPMLSSVGELPEHIR
ncbi:MAG: HAD family hydrolase [Candidatus Moranbacteria bacterium]|nr:HAD family hydrolase [bacterium]MDP1834224.1 HAD family hydrolase [Candidatus Moranbacteria bacterium]